MLGPPGGSRRKCSCPLICEGAAESHPDQRVSSIDRRISGFGFHLTLKNQPRRPGRVPALYALCPRCGCAAVDRGASCRMTSSVYRPLCSFGFACSGGRFSVPCEVIRSGGDDSYFVLRHGLRPDTCASYFVTGSARTRSATEPHALRATTWRVTRNTPLRGQSVQPVEHDQTPHVASRATP